MAKANFYSSFWLSSDQFLKYDQILKLSIIQKTISNFVNIITNKNIECVFLENTSNTKNAKNKNEKHGYSTAEKILISADVNNIDLIIGLALHEATHITKSDFNYKNKLSDEIINFKISLTFENRAKFDNLFHLLVNFIEDLRCDSFQLKESPGYIGYYKALYQSAFISDEIAIQLKTSETKSEHIKNYIFRILNLFHKDFDIESLMGLKNIFNIIQVENIDRLQSTNNSVELAWNVFNELTKFCDVFAFDFDENDLDIILKKQIKFILHQFEKRKINSSTKQKIDNLLESNIKFISCNTKIGKIQTAVFEDLNFNKISLYKQLQEKNIKAISKGEILGDKLKNKLQLRNEIKELIFNRKSSGRLDKKNLYSLQFNDKIFYNKKIEQQESAYIHISIDASGSMNAYWNKLITILISLIKSFKEFRNIKTVISFRNTFSYNNKETPVVYIVYDSEKSKFELFKHFLKFFSPFGQTPDGICFSSILNRIKNESQNKKSYFVNISDGLPYFHEEKSGILYCNEIAYDHTRLEINKMKKANIEVLSFYIGEKSAEIENAFKKIYGQNSIFIQNFENINKIVNIINSLFI